MRRRLADRRVIPEAVRILTAIGFIARGDSGAEGSYLLVKDSGPDVRIVHVHIVELCDPQWEAYVTFRDALRRDFVARAEYEALKGYLAERYREDRRAYTAGKNQFIREVLNRIGLAGSSEGSDTRDNSKAG